MNKVGVSVILVSLMWNRLVAGTEKGEPVKLMYLIHKKKNGDHSAPPVFRRVEVSLDVQCI